MGTGKVTLRELETWYSIEDVYLMIEVSAVDSYNAYLVNEAQATKNATR